jgi:hypothetical protein
MPSKATLHVPKIKVAVPLAAESLPHDLVPPDGPAGEPILDLVLSGTPIGVQARLNGKSVRRVLKQIAEQGTGNVVVVLQGILRPPAQPGGPFLLEEAGLQLTVKTPKPEPAGEAPSTPS